jgi:hypothetical protein
MGNTNSNLVGGALGDDYHNIGIPGYVSPVVVKKAKEAVKDDHQNVLSRQDVAGKIQMFETPQPKPASPAPKLDLDRQDPKFIHQNDKSQNL